MSAPNLSGGSLPSSTAAKASYKGTKQSKRVVLRLSPSVLGQFPSAQPTRKASRSKPPAAPTPASPLTIEPEPHRPAPEPEREATPVPETQPVSTPQDSASNGQKRKGIPGPKPGGVKRPAPGLDLNGLPKPRGKPGPKKRLRADGDSIAPSGGPVPTSHHKLGPKFHQGAINAGLRALDRTGRPCRKWRQTGFQLKSFTGVTWELPSWRTPKPKDSSFNGHVKGETTGSSDAKPGHASSGAESDKSNSGLDNAVTSAPVEMTSSPAPVALVEISSTA